MTLSAADDSYTSFQHVKCSGTILSFSDTHFGQPTDFDRAVLRSNATEFHGAIFDDEANFKRVVFPGSDTYFDLAQFRRGVDYSYARFRSWHSTEFRGVTFAGVTSFSHAVFASPTLFASDRFMEHSTNFEDADFRNKVAFVQSVVWSNVAVDWDAPVPYAPRGPQPSTVTPTSWPPTPAETEDETSLEAVTIDEHAMAREFFHRDRRREFMRILAQLKRFGQRRMRRWW
ncbi:pentapeptide repeat-containing protein [Nocardia gamkensis]|uniref:Pentapeptide repeat-containing protein n=1 Tax=Nocardia gamkensis TaxID=352869 RepID=A0A7X6L177_9NOCA|nr:pentapeptide repeat-containing protein [Nocardia gamkensis]NKY25865.1 pentapeptide repeat-containing protein [Nocardia gamkensis]NQE68943.1 hypothetical protein [Nocardia gamkensis]